MKKSFLTAVFVFIVVFLMGQSLHSPSEIFQIMEKSPVSYELNLLDSIIPVPDRTENLNYNFYYRVIDENSISTFRYETSETANNYFSKAEKYYSEGNYDLAREMYLKVLETDSNYFEVMTYIGQMYENEGDIDNAIKWFKIAIDHNYIDYMAHWFLADAYQDQGDLDKAVDEITIALILNRNNPRIKDSFSNIYKKKKLKSSDWTFNPQMRIDSIGINKVKISFEEVWLGYALVKALWEFEPGYSESMGVTKGTYSTIQDKEALLGLMSGLNKKKIKKEPEFKALNKSFDNKMLDEFILFEIVLPDIPMVAYQLPKETILDIKNYVIQVRGN